MLLRCRATARHLFLATAAVAVLTACSTVPERDAGAPDLVAWQQRQQQLGELEGWAFNGRIAVRDGRDEGWNASLRWQQRGGHFDIQLSGAFGQGAARIHGDGASAVVEVAGEAPRAAPNAEMLMQEQLGWHVPVQGLRYWLTGSPAPEGSELEIVDGLGRLSRLVQGGWEVLYSRYETVDGIDLPRKLEMSNPRLRVRLVIDQWSIERRGVI